MNVKKSDPNSQKATPINSPAASNLNLFTFFIIIYFSMTFFNSFLILLLHIFHFFLLCI